MKKSLIIGIIAIIFLLIIGVYYFSFVYMSESQARKIIVESYNQNPTSICNRFYVDDSRCLAFTECYIEKAVPAMPKNLLIQFAKDIKVGKSSAMDSYSLVNGKQIGQDCLAKILNVPDNVNINLINVE
ncbi:MAG: hypothetical protein KKB21_05240 [Nanoarchaeota archaeon]|nr:hypothetical protein [Nanoarchaeota archaeon]MBU4086951.1 hypothetical protein [Nanoarchaeota archaeon]